MNDDKLLANEYTFKWLRYYQKFLLGFFWLHCANIILAIANMEMYGIFSGFYLILLLASVLFCWYTGKTVNAVTGFNKAGYRLNFIFLLSIPFQVLVLMLNFRTILQLFLNYNLLVFCFIGVVASFLLIVLPNLIYFKKRISLFIGLPWDFKQIPKNGRLYSYFKNSDRLINAGSYLFINELSIILKSMLSKEEIQRIGYNLYKTKSESIFDINEKESFNIFIKALFDLLTSSSDTNIKIIESINLVEHIKILQDDVINIWKTGIENQLYNIWDRCNMT